MVLITLNNEILTYCEETLHKEDKNLNDLNNAALIKRNHAIIEHSVKEIIEGYIKALPYPYTLDYNPFTVNYRPTGYLTADLRITKCDENYGLLEENIIVIKVKAIPFIEGTRKAEQILFDIFKTTGDIRQRIS